MKDTILFVSLDFDGEFFCGTEGSLVCQREEADLVQSIRGIGDQLTKEDLASTNNVCHVYVCVYMQVQEVCVCVCVWYSRNEAMYGTRTHPPLAN